MNNFRSYGTNALPVTELDRDTIATRITQENHMTPTTEQLKDLLAKVTPGEWRVEVDESAAQVKGYPCIEADNYTIVGLEGMYGDIDTDFTNATLIALAPTLAAEVVRLREHIKDINAIVDECEYDKKTRKTVDRLRTIAKEATK